MMFCRLLIFPLKFKTFLQDYHQSGKQVGSRLAERFVGPDLGPNCLERLSADDSSKQRVPEILSYNLLMRSRRPNTMGATK